MDQDKTTVMGGYGSAQAGDSADATRVVPNPGYTDPAATQPSAEPTRVMGYGDTAQDSLRCMLRKAPYGNAAPDPFDYAPQDSYAASTPNPYDNLPQNPIPQPQQTTYTAAHGAGSVSLRVARAVSRVSQVDSAI